MTRERDESKKLLRSVNYAINTIYICIIESSFVSVIRHFNGLRKSRLLIYEVVMMTSSVA